MQLQRLEKLRRGNIKTVIAEVSYMYCIHYHFTSDALIDVFLLPHHKKMWLHYVKHDLCGALVDSCYINVPACE